MHRFRESIEDIRSEVTASLIAQEAYICKVLYKLSALATLGWWMIFNHIKMKTLSD